jgi:hypothetical protein
MDGVKDWLSSQAANCNDVGIQKLMSCYDSALVQRVIMSRSSLRM